MARRGATDEGDLAGRRGGVEPFGFQLRQDEGVDIVADPGGVFGRGDRRFDNLLKSPPAALLGSEVLLQASGKTYDPAAVQQALATAVANS